MFLDSKENFIQKLKLNLEEVKNNILDFKKLQLLFFYFILILILILDLLIKNLLFYL
jgi:hypothetical protein